MKSGHLRFYKTQIFFIVEIKEEDKKQHYRKKISEYMDRAEKIKDTIKKEKDGTHIFTLSLRLPFILKTQLYNVIFNVILEATHKTVTMSNGI